MTVMTPLVQSLPNSGSRCLPAGARIGIATQTAVANTSNKCQVAPQSGNVKMSGPYYFMVHAHQPPDVNRQAQNSNVLYCQQPPVRASDPVVASADLTPMGESKLAGGRRQRRKRIMSDTGVSQAVPDDELQEMRAAVMDMLRTQEGNQSVISSQKLHDIKANILENMSSRDNPPLVASDSEHSDQNTAKKAHDYFDKSVSYENNFVEKWKADEAIARLSSDTISQHHSVFAWLTRPSESLWPIAASKHGCRVVQKALDVLCLQERIVLAYGLRGHVCEALESPHANHVLQKLVDVVDPTYLKFVIEEMKGMGAFFARRRFGCRVVERLLEHCPSEYLAELVDEILQDAERLSRHPYGNFVMQHIFRYGTVEQKHRLVLLLREDVARLARHRHASHVVEAAFTNCAREDTLQLMEALNSELSNASRPRCGGIAARELLEQLPTGYAR